MHTLISIIFAIIICLSQISCYKQKNVATYVNKPSNIKMESNSNNNTSPDTTRRFQDSGEIHFGRANSLAEGGKFAEALEEYNLAITNGYDTAELRILMGILLGERLHCYEEATEQFRIALRLNEDSPRVHFLLAKSLLAIKQYEEALKEIEIVRRLDRDNNYGILYNYYKADALYRLERYSEALEEYKTFIQAEEKIAPNSSEVREAKERVVLIKEKLDVSN